MIEFDEWTEHWNVDCKFWCEMCWFLFCFLLTWSTRLRLWSQLMWCCTTTRSFVRTVHTWTYWAGRVNNFARTLNHRIEIASGWSRTRSTTAKCKWDLTTIKTLAKWIKMIKGISCYLDMGLVLKKILIFIVFFLVFLVTVEVILSNQIPNQRLLVVAYWLSWWMQPHIFDWYSTFGFNESRCWLTTSHCDCGPFGRETNKQNHEQITIKRFSQNILVFCCLFFLLF